jgi:hypothetical protein
VTTLLPATSTNTVCTPPSTLLYPT